ncbi:hypothetical protein H4R34_002253 [Dimargaris verticillata]|uniref:RanBD1 domain-containing protein n=1 Tax=Dimargaris verticillata TaxID=2761393 RepID=A0A9W8B249_9FUNG|nr:hypothetical protein H4R34_002253 [Dimargaris verticillata]
MAASPKDLPGSPDLPATSDYASTSPPDAAPLKRRRSSADASGLEPTAESLTAQTPPGSTGSANSRPDSPVLAKDSPSPSKKIKLQGSPEPESPTEKDSDVRTPSDIKLQPEHEIDTSKPSSGPDAPPGTSLASKTSSLKIHEDSTMPTVTKPVESTATPSALRLGFAAHSSNASPFATVTGNALSKGSDLGPKGTFGAKYSGPSFASFASVSSGPAGGTSIFSSAAAKVAPTAEAPSASPSVPLKSSAASASSETALESGDQSEKPSASKPDAFTPKAVLASSKGEPVEVKTGEEDEDTLYQTKCKLYELDEAMQWRERGAGVLKVNQQVKDPDAVRLVMRTDVVFKVILNAKLFSGMSCELAQDRFVRFGVVDANRSLKTYAIKASTKDAAKALHETIVLSIPSADSSSDAEKKTGDSAEQV